MIKEESLGSDDEVDDDNDSDADDATVDDDGRKKRKADEMNSDLTIQEAFAPIPVKVESKRRTFPPAKKAKEGNSKKKEKAPEVASEMKLRSRAVGKEIVPAAAVANVMVADSAGRKSLVGDKVMDKLVEKTIGLGRTMKEV